MFYSIYTGVEDICIVTGLGRKVDGHAKNAYFIALYYFASFHDSVLQRKKNEI